MSYCGQLPVYTLRQSRRVKSLRLKISVNKGLEVIVPEKFDLSKIPAFLKKHANWIDRHLSVLPKKQPQEFPASIEFTALQESWKIDYISIISKKIQIQTYFKYNLIVIGNLKNWPLVKKALQVWIKNHAEKFLSDWLESLSIKTGLFYKKVMIRQAESRWGSCSAQKHISLNVNLIFLSPDLVEHVLLHELCHTVYLNHSQKFWQLLESVNTGSQVLRKRLSQAQQLLPAWW